MSKYLVGVLVFNGLYPLSNDKEAPKAFIVLYFFIIVVDDLIWVDKLLQDIACSNNANEELL